MVEYRGIERFPSYLFGSDGTIHRKGRGPLKQRLKANGYLDAPLCESGKYHVRYAHRLICEAFHGEPPSRFECRHKNGIKDDNRAENLAWASHRDNEADKIHHGTKLLGENSYNAILTESAVMMARDMARDGVREIDIAERLGVGRITVHDAIVGRNWKHLPGAIRRGRWPVTTEEARKADLLPVRTK